MASKWKAEVDGYLEIGKVTTGCECFFFKFQAFFFLRKEDVLWKIMKNTVPYTGYIVNE